MVHGVGRPIEETIGDDIGSGGAEGVVGDGVGDAERSQAEGARGLNAGR